MTVQDKQKALKVLNNKLAMDTSLPLKATATNDVPGEGSPEAEILFVGEAPGAREDALGRPFVGAAGKFLDELIASIGLKRADIFIANLIKHRPPGNRDPLPEEIEAYAPYLEKQMSIIEPKIIVTLGRHSMQYFLGEGLSISKIHGQPKRRNGRIVMPMYHPAAALYSGNLRPVLKADFAKLPKVIKLLEKGEDLQLVETPAVSEKQKAAESQQSLL
ncbi:MAG: uracil-DNA glycosylase [Candidatus Andersenbacteria bacterium]|nr:uracil-DNA glycosylase [Candidatus Andersenbacteria bacterium]MBI3250690.1 uracil-DNA glycosylase [Candidatus Andersenbacteria bacterium]